MKKKDEKKEVKEEVLEVKTEISPLTQEFGNGDLNVLRDKINEIIKRG